MNSCLDPTVSTQDACVDEFYPSTVGMCSVFPNSSLINDCMTGASNGTFPRLWGPWYLGSANFDDIFNSLNMVTQASVVPCTTVGPWHVDVLLY